MATPKALPSKPSLLSGEQLDALRGLAAHGTSESVRTLSALLGAQVEGTHPRAHVAPRGLIHKVLAVGNEETFATHFEIEGAAGIRQLIHFTKTGATLMAGLLLAAGKTVQTPFDPRSSVYVSSLAEAGNVIISAYLNGVGAAVGRKLVCSVPHVIEGPLEGATRTAFAEMDEVVLLVTDLRLPGVRAAGRIVTAIEEGGVRDLLLSARSR